LGLGEWICDSSSYNNNNDNNNNHFDHYEYNSPYHYHGRSHNNSSHKHCSNHNISVGKVMDMKKLMVSVLVGVVSLAGCSSSSSNDDVSTTVVVATTTSVEESTPNQATDAYSLIGGGSIDLTRGPTAMPMALWFWAPG
jgi:hypothetical protein